MFGPISQWGVTFFGSSHEGGGAELVPNELARTPPNRWPPRMGALRIGVVRIGVVKERLGMGRDVVTPAAVE